MNQELLKQIEILNHHLADLTQKSEGLFDILKETKGVNIGDFITAFIGLFGVFVGAYISHRYNKRIANESSKARFAIQRKNLIYSKIYKELVYIKEQISLLPANGFYFQARTNIIDTQVNNQTYNDYWINGERNYIAPEFKIWKKIKSDVRSTQVNSSVFACMNKLEEAMVSYFQSSNQFLKDFDRKKISQIARGHVDITEFFFSDFNKEKFITKMSGKFTKPENNKELEEAFLTLADSVMASLDLKKAGEDFNKLKKALDDAHFILENLIKDIVNKYEYGEEI